MPQTTTRTRSSTGAGSGVEREGLPLDLDGYMPSWLVGIVLNATFIDATSTRIVIIIGY